jgi:UDP-glucose 4-epimerase
VHLAAKVQVNESVTNPQLYYETNINGTINILQGVKTKNFIFASTGAAEHLNSPYAVSKKACEEIVQQYCSANNIDYTIFRFYIVIGSIFGIQPSYSYGLFHALTTAPARGYINIYGTDYNTVDGTCVRDYVHVMEICNAIITAINSPSNSIESLGHGFGYTVRNIINMYQEVNSVSFNIIDCPKRLGDLERTVVDKPSSYMVSLYSIQEMLVCH